MCLGEVFICCVAHETKPVEGRFVTHDESFIYAILSRRKHVHAFLPVSVTSFGVICVCVCVCVASEPGQFLSPCCILARHHPFLLLYDDDNEAFSSYISLSIKYRK